MHETRGSYWNYIETIIIIRFMLYRSAQIFQEPISMYPIFRNRKPGRDRVAPLTMNESLSIRVGREPNVNRRKRKKVFWMKIGEGSQIGEREREREREREKGGAVLWSVRRFISTERGKDVRLFFSWPYSWPDDSIVECICINSALKPI